MYTPRRSIPIICICCCRFRQHYRVDKAIDHLKRDSHGELLWTFKALKQRYRGGHVWSKGYWIGSSGNVSEQMWQQYIRNAKPPSGYR